MIIIAINALQHMSGIGLALSIDTALVSNNNGAA
jgi:hypothetical protein